MADPFDLDIQNHTPPDSLDRLELQLLCERARGAVSRMRQAREVIIHRREGQPEPMQVVTGRSAMDDVVAGAQAILARLEAQLEASAPSPLPHVEVKGARSTVTVGAGSR